MYQDRTPRPATRPRGITQMSTNGLGCEIHMPKATQSRFGERGEELTSRLASYALQEVYRVDDFPGCPRGWLRDDPATGRATFFVEAKVGHMAWLNFSRSASHTHHVAAIISAQGINAITGRPMVEPVRLEQYQTHCPVHLIAFVGTNKHCNECGFEWPDQNYIATTTVGGSGFWRDGFRAKDGKTREFVFTENVERGVAANVIGDDRGFAIATRLFLSKEPKPQPVYRGGGLESLESMDGGGKIRTLSATRSAAPEIAAGAVVNQTVGRDSLRLDAWQTDPTATFVIYYVYGDVLDEILASGGATSGGSRSGGEGFLGGVKVGTP